MSTDTTPTTEPAAWLTFVGFVLLIGEPAAGSIQLQASPNHIVSSSQGPSSSVRSYQEAYLREGNDSQNSREYGQNKREEGDRVLERSAPQSRPPLPSGFGWVVLTGAAGGALFGALWCVILWVCLRDRSPKDES